MSTRIGTCHFVNVIAAQKYYAPYGSDAFEKIQNGEIKIGPPQLKEGERSFVNDEGRYVIVVEDKGE